MAALGDVRVIDLTEALAGPYCTMILGDLGADVIKIEKPGVGDQSRKWGPPFVGTESAYFLSINRNKRSVALDIKHSDDRERLQSLLQDADVFVCNLRRMESLCAAGLDPQTLRAQNPRLIYCSISAYGRTGPYADRGGYDLVAQAEAGLMAATGDENGEPMRWPVAIADLSCGLWSANAIITALYVREKTGQGQFIDQALLDGQLSWAAVMTAQYFASGELPARLGNRHANIVPYQVFKARDRYMMIAVGTESLWRRFCRAIGLGGQLSEDPRFVSNSARLEHRHELCALLEALFAERDAAVWLDALRAAEVPSGPILALDETLRDPQIQHRGMVIGFDHPEGPFKCLGNPLQLSGTPVAYRRRPPLLGEHTEEVLAEIERNRCTSRSGQYPCATVASPSLQRYLARIGVRIELHGSYVTAMTINVSERGCDVRWSGQTPQIGDEATMRVLGNRIEIAIRVAVRWLRVDTATESTVGLEILRDTGPRATPDPWSALVAKLVQAGASAA